MRSNDIFAELQKKGDNELARNSLRDYSKTNSEWVRKFIEDHKSKCPY